MSDVVIRDPNWPERGDVPAVVQEGAISSIRYGLGVVRSRWRLAAIAAIVTAIVTGATAIFLLPHNEYAEATIVIQPVAQNLAQPEAQQSVLPPDTSAVDTQVEVLRSPAVAEDVVRKLKLYQDPEFGGKAGATIGDASLRKSVAAVMTSSRIRRIGLTYVIQVGFFASSVEKAKRIANAITSAYINDRLDDKLAAVSRANRDLGKILGTLRRRALETQSKVQDYESAHHLLDVKGTSLTESELSELNQRVADAEADVAEKRGRLSVAQSQARNGQGGADIGATLNSGTISALRQKEADVSAKLSQLKAEFLPSYPPVQKAQAELNDVRAELHAETTRILSSLSADAKASEERESSLLASRKTAESRLETSNRERVGLLTLQQSADTATKIYETYLTRASEVTAARSLQQVDATVESPAIAITSGGFASKRAIIAISALFAVIAGALAVAFSEMWNPGLRSRAEVARCTGLPLAGVIPKITDRTADNPANHVAQNPLAACAEAYRTLQAFLSLSRPAPQSRVIAVTSALPGEGKSLTSVCLARTFAASGARVIVLDCDLRRAGASKYFPKPRFGMAEVISRSAMLEQALIRDPKSGVWFLSAATTENLSGDFFGRASVDELLAALSQKFDRIVIDTSPVMGFADARILAAKAGTVLHVVEWNKTPEPIVRASIDILRQSRANLAGVVLNKVDINRQANLGMMDGSDYLSYFDGAYALPG